MEMLVKYIMRRLTGQFSYLQRQRASDLSLANIKWF